ncbi:hypothetical protein D3C77_314970 [compost metagenome]
MVQQQLCLVTSYLHTVHEQAVQVDLVELMDALRSQPGLERIREPDTARMVRYVDRPQLNVELEHRRIRQAEVAERPAHPIFR